MGRSKAPKDTVKIAVRRQNALLMRAARASYQQIADKLGVSIGTAHRDVQTALSKLENDSTETAKEVRRLELLELDRLQAAHSVAATADPRRAELCLKIMDRRHRLEGLLNDMGPAPQPVSIVIMGESDDEDEDSKDDN